jgi:hypothetical protein
MIDASDGGGIRHHVFSPRVRGAEADLKHQELRSGDLQGYRGTIVADQ